MRARTHPPIVYGKVIASVYSCTKSGSCASSMKRALTTPSVRDADRNALADNPVHRFPDRGPAHVRIRTNRSIFNGVPGWKRQLTIVSRRIRNACSPGFSPCRYRFHNLKKYAEESGDREYCIFHEMTNCPRPEKLSARERNRRRFLSGSCCTSAMQGNNPHFHARRGSIRDLVSDRDRDGIKLA